MAKSNFPYTSRNKSNLLYTLPNPSQYLPLNDAKPRPHIQKHILAIVSMAPTPNQLVSLAVHQYLKKRDSKDHRDNDHYVGSLSKTQFYAIIGGCLGLVILILLAIFWRSSHSHRRRVYGKEYAPPGSGYALKDHGHGLGRWTRWNVGAMSAGAAGGGSGAC